MTFASARNYDTDGRLHVSRSNISKADVNPYLGAEIPGYQALGLQADKIYQMYRDPNELANAASTFERLPILFKHVPHKADSNLKDITIGTIGSNVAYDAPYLVADLSFWDATAIAAIESGEIKELSCSYRYVPVMEAGSADGVPYDGKMTQIEGNHLALVPVGRAGADVVVADEKPITTWKNHMSKHSKLGKALVAAICAASPVIAADSGALVKLLANADKKLDKPAAIKAILAMDADMKSDQLDNIIDAITDVEQDPKPTELAAGDDHPLKKFLGEKGFSADEIAHAMDLVEPKEDKVEAAMDSMRKELRQLRDAERDVRSIVGDVVAMDSADQVYRFALDHLKIEHDGVKELPALKALFKVASNAKSVPESAPLASDSATLSRKLPGLARFN
jgi:hypothetical protein